MEEKASNISEDEMMVVDVKKKCPSCGYKGFVSITSDWNEAYQKGLDAGKSHLWDKDLLDCAKNNFERGKDAHQHKKPDCKLCFSMWKDGADFGRKEVTEFVLKDVEGDIPTLAFKHLKEKLGRGMFNK